MHEQIESFVCQMPNAVTRGRVVQEQNPDQHHNQGDGWRHPAVPGPVAFDAEWTRDDEDAIKDLYTIHYRKKLIEAPALRTLWKYTLRYLQCTPWDIIGVEHKLAFSPATQFQPGHGEEPTMFGWSAAFITALTPLIVHPAWRSSVPGENVAKLAAAIQYAIILRTGDRRRWHITLRGNFWPIFQQFIDASAGNIDSFPGIHAAAREEAGRRGVEVPSLSLVLQSLEARIDGAKGADRISVDTPTSPYMYDLATSDLTVLKKALDRTVDPVTGWMLYMPVKLLYKATEACRNTTSDPPRESDFKRYYHAAAVKDQLRQARKMERNSTQVHSQAPAILPAQVSADVAPSAQPSPEAMAGNSEAVDGPTHLKMEDEDNKGSNDIVHEGNVDDHLQHTLEYMKEGAEHLLRLLPDRRNDRNADEESRFFFDNLDAGFEKLRMLRDLPGN